MDKSLNKFISETGFCSRREADKYIDQARVTINSNIAVKGNRVQPGDVVEIDGEPIKKKDKIVYLVFNKPIGITCTTDLKDKDNIISFINFKSRIFPVGRLDKPSEGLIFLTNDGDIVNKILRAGNNHEKEYVVTVDKPINQEFIAKMSNGVKILETITKKCVVKQEGKNRFRIVLVQGLNRQIRRMCQVLGYHVHTLKRVRIMNITLANLPVGKWRYFTADEINTIEKSLSASVKTEDGSYFE
ncbi:MAG: 23S rRNA pseudouridine(2604) synthase RluF [Ferruginibacter sp.]|nr:23S rRNA pseudouridine(2604) synthase RluF [Ferruginibacter sp.]